jgi:hypothetical protein
MQRLEMGVKPFYMGRMVQMIKWRPLELFVLPPERRTFRDQSLVFSMDRVGPVLSHVPSYHRSVSAGSVQATGTRHGDTDETRKRARTHAEAIIGAL